MDRFQTGILRAYEVLKGLGGGFPNRLKALLAFLEPEFAARDGQLLDSAEFISAVNQSMGLGLTDDAFQDLLPHIEKVGWIVQVTGLPGVQYSVSCHKPPIPDPSSIEALNRLANSFAEFLDSREVSIANFPRDHNYLGECLVEWLLSIDTSDELSMAAATRSFENSSEQIEYFCARFVDDLIRNKSADVEDLQLIANVGLLSDMVREFKKPLAEIKNTDLTIALDSPLLLELLGVSGESSRLAATELVTRLSKRGAKFLFFDASINELQHSIDGMFELPVYERYGPTHSAMQRGEIDEGYVQSVRHNCRDLLQKLGVSPLSRVLKDRSTSWHIVTSQHVDKLTRDLESVYDSQRSSRFRARHDAQAVAAIMRLRGGEFATSDVFRAKYVFLTRNETFRNTARAFCVRDTPPGTALMSTEETGPVIDIKEMASAIFARMPLDESAEFSRLSLMAACERVLRLNRKTVLKISTIVNRIALSADPEAIRKVHIAMLHPGSSLYIQDRIRGEDKRLSYEDVLAEQKRFEQDNIDKGIEKGRIHYQQQLQDIEDTLQRERERADALAADVRARDEAISQAALERDAAVQRAEKDALAQAERERDARGSERRRALRIIANVERARARLRGRLRLFMLAVVVVVIAVKLFVEKVWSAAISAEVAGLPLWIPIAIVLALVVFAIEAAGGIFGDIKFSFVRNWLANRLRSRLERDQEYEEFLSNRFGFSIEQNGLDFALTEQPAAGDASVIAAHANAADTIDGDLD